MTNNNEREEEEENRNENRDRIRERRERIYEGLITANPRVDSILADLENNLDNVEETDPDDTERERDQIRERLESIEDLIEATTLTASDTFETPVPDPALSDSSRSFIPITDPAVHSIRTVENPPGIGSNAGIGSNVEVNPFYTRTIAPPTFATLQLNGISIGSADSLECMICKKKGGVIQFASIKRREEEEVDSLSICIKCLKNSLLEHRPMTYNGRLKVLKPNSKEKNNKRKFDYYNAIK